MSASNKIRYDELSGRQKVAILLMSLEMESASKIFAMVDPTDVELIAVDIANLQGIDGDVIDQVINEFYEMMAAREYYVEGGMDYALLLLEKTFGIDKAREIIEKIKVLTTIRGFDILKAADSQQLANFLSKEHPQVISLILSHLTPDQTASVLAEFEDELRTDVVMRIASLGKVSPQLVSEVESVVDRVAESTIQQNLAKTGGSQLVAAILNKSSGAHAKQMMENIEIKNPELATDIKRQMFLFEDMILIDDKGIQRILRDVDKKDLALSMKVSDEKLKTKIFKNMSERAAGVIREELDFMGPVKLKEVEAAQMRIVEVIKRLEESEEITIGGRGKAEDVFV